MASRSSSPAGDVPAPPADTYYHYQLLDMAVVDEAGSSLGTVTEILHTGANDVYVVADGESELLLPALADVVRDVDVEARRMSVALPDGIERRRLSGPKPAAPPAASSRASPALRRNEGIGAPAMPTVAFGIMAAKSITTARALRGGAMSGHSKWSTIKHKKAAIDAKKGVAFTKLARDITVAAREGGSGDPTMNFRLRLVIDKARAANMPADNVDRAIKKGLGQSADGVAFEEIVYEGYGPGGAAIMLMAMTDNRNRTASEVRSVFSRCGGNLGETGSVAWNFESKAVVAVEECGADKAEEVALDAIDAGRRGLQGRGRRH